MKKISIREWFIILIALLAISSALWGYYNPKVVEVPGKTEYRDVTEHKGKPVAVKITAKASSKNPVQSPECPKCPEYFDCAAYSASDEKHEDQSCEVIAIEGELVDGFPVTAKAKCPQGKVGYDVASTINPEDGKTSIFIRPEKRSLFSFENSKEIGIRYGLRPEFDLFGRWTFLRVGDFYTSIYAEANTDIKANAMIEVSYRW